MKRRHLSLWLSLLLWLPTLAANAAGPAWWTTSGVVSTNQVTNDYAAINLGQLKNMATQAKAEMDANLPGGAGSNVTALINGFSPSTNNYFSANIGQLKNIAKPFYDRLIAVGYTNAYPWPAGTNDYAVANVGQLKYLFSWSVSATTLGDGIPDWWRQYYFGNGTNTNSNSCASCDPDTDGWSNVEEYLNGTNPFQADPGITNFDFIVNGGLLYSTSQTVSVQGVLTNYPNFLVSVDSQMSNATMLVNSGTQNYTLVDTNDGIQEIFLQYAFSPQQRIGPIVSKVVNLDRTPPVVYITSPASTAVLNQAFMTLQAVAYDPDPTNPTPSRPVSIFINGQQFWGRSGTNINIQLFPVPSGTNSFTVTIQVIDQVGNSNQTSRTWSVDPSTATNAPSILTVNVTTNMLLPDVDSIWMEGDMDNSNALVTVVVSSDSGDVTTNSLNVWNAHYEGLVPLESGTNQIYLTAAKAGGYSTSKAFTAINSTDFQAAITNPVFGVFAPVRSNTVSGYVSALFDAGLPTQTNITSVLINGVPAILGTNIDGNGNVPFWTTNYIPLNTPIIGTIGGTGIPTAPAPTLPPAQSQVYEVTHKVQINDGFIGRPTVSRLSEPFGFFSGFWTLWLSNECWTAAHSGNTTRCLTNLTEDLNLTTSSVQSNTSKTKGVFPACMTDFDVDRIPWNMDSPTITSSTIAGPISRGLYFGTYDYKHGQGTVQEAVGTDTPGIYQNFTLYFRAMQRQLDSGEVTFIAPREYGTNTTVIFTFEGVDYQRPDGVARNLSQVKYLGQSPITYSNEAKTVSYLLTVDGGKRYTINQDDFQWPSFRQPHHETDWSGPLPALEFIQKLDFVGDWTEDMHWLSWTNFHNHPVDLIVQVVGQGCNKPDLRIAAQQLKINYPPPQINPYLIGMRRACQNAGSFSVYVYQGHAGLTNGQPQIAAYTGKVCGVTTNCPAGAPTYDAPLLCFIPLTWLADAYYLTTSVSPSMVNDFTGGQGMSRLVVIIGCESGTSWQPGFTQAGAKVVIYSGGEGDAATESAAINAFFNTLAGSPSSTIDQALSSANAIIDDYNMHPAAIGQMNDMTAVYGSGASGASTFADIIKP